MKIQKNYTALFKASK